MLFTLLIAHPMVMFRHHKTGPFASLRYDPTIVAAPDYDFFERRLAHCEGANVARPLVSYCVHPKSISQTKWREQLQTTKRVAVRRQKADLPTEIFNALADFRAALYDHESVPAGRILDGLRASLRHSGATLRPGRVKREALALYVMARSDQSWPAVAIGIVILAPSLLLHSLAFDLADRLKGKRD